MNGDEVELRDYIEVIRKQKWIIILAAAVATISALVVSLKMTPIYQASTTLMVSSPPEPTLNLLEVFKNTQGLPSQYQTSYLKSYQELIKSRGLAEKVIEALDLDITADVLGGKNLSVNLLTGTNIIQIKVENPDPHLAANIANKTTEVLIAENREMYSGGVKKASTYVEEQLKLLETDMIEKREELEELKNLNSSLTSEKITQLENKIKASEDIYKMLLSEYEQAQVVGALELNNIWVVDSAKPPKFPIKPRKKRNTILGLVIGLMFGVGLAFFLEYLDNTIKTPDDVKQYLALPVLSNIPHTASEEKLRIRSNRSVKS